MIGHRSGVRQSFQMGITGWERAAEKRSQAHFCQVQLGEWLLLEDRLQMGANSNTWSLWPATSPELLGSWGTILEMWVVREQQSGRLSPILGIQLEAASSKPPGWTVAIREVIHFRRYAGTFLALNALKSAGPILQVMPLGSLLHTHRRNRTFKKCLFIIIIMAAIVAEFNHVPRHSVSTYLPECHMSVILITTPWAVSYYCPHFADEETGPRGSSNLLESTSQQMVEPEFQLKWLNARAWAFNTKRDQECFGVALWKEIQHFDRSEICAVCFPPWWADTNLRHLLPSLGSICFISPRTAVHSVETLWEAKVPYSFSDHKTLFNKIPQAQAPKNHVINLPSK